MTTLERLTVYIRLGWPADVRNYAVAVAIFLLLAYSVYVFLPVEAIRPLVREDGLFEYLTAMFFLAASVIFLLAFRRQRNWYLLLLSLVFFVGCGEEISWGQRIIGFETPAVIAERNVQKEFTLHNLDVLDASGLDGERKAGIRRLLTVNFMYKLFWLTYAILLPLLAVGSGRMDRLIRGTFRLPLPPLAVGVFFAINWLISKISLLYLLTPVPGEPNAYEIGEVQECISAFIFMVIGLYLYRHSLSRRADRQEPDSPAFAGEP